jgi:hypothetical protein
MCSLSAVEMQSICSRCAVLLPLCMLFVAHSLMHQLLVCNAIQVSVSVRLACLNMRALPRTPGHHSRFVSLLCCWPARHGIGLDGASCWSLSIAEVVTHDLRVAPGRRGTATPDKTGRDEPHCTVPYDVMGQNSPSLLVVIMKATTQVLDDADISRVVTSSWRWLVTTRVGPGGSRRKTQNLGAAHGRQESSLCAGAGTRLRTLRTSRSGSDGA